jgi:hypothetical protein
MEVLPLLKYYCLFELAALVYELRFLLREDPIRPPGPLNPILLLVEVFASVFVAGFTLDLLLITLGRLKICLEL